MVKRELFFSSQGSGEVLGIHRVSLSSQGVPLEVDPCVESGSI